MCEFSAAQNGNEGENNLLVRIQHASLLEKFECGLSGVDH